MNYDIDGYKMYVGYYDGFSRWMVAINEFIPNVKWVEHTRKYLNTEQEAYAYGMQWISDERERQERERVSKELWEKMIDKYLQTGLVP